MSPKESNAKKSLGTAEIHAVEGDQSELETESSLVIDESIAEPQESIPDPQVALDQLKEITAKASLQTELEDSNMDLQQVANGLIGVARSRAVFPALRSNDTEQSYIKRAIRKVWLFRISWAIFGLFLAISIGAILYSGNELYRKPALVAEHHAFLAEYYSDTLINTHIPIDAREPSVPNWLWSNFSPGWYIEDAIYSNRLDSADKDIELLGMLREKMAIAVREIEPAYSNDKIQNRLRDPNIIYFGRDYEKSHRRYLNLVLTVLALTNEDNPNPNLSIVFNPKKRSELIQKITLPRPPEPNEFYDSRVVALIAEIEQDQPLISSDGGIINPQESEKARMLEMLDDLFTELDPTEFLNLSNNGLGSLMRALPNGWGSTNLTRAFYENKRNRFIDWQILETRLLMLDLIFTAAKLPQELPLRDLYLHHIGGEGFQTLFDKYRNKKLLDAAIDWVGKDIVSENILGDREARFILEFADSKHLKVADGDNDRAILALFYKAARFEVMYEKVEKSEQALEARPYLGKLDLPVASIEPDEIKPWGLYHARRNGYRHKGLDIGGIIGEPVLAVMDGAIIRAGYQKRGAGNYVVLKQDNIEVTYMHLLREPSRSNYKRLLTRDEMNEFGDNPRKGYEIALKRYASIVLGKSMQSLTAKDLSITELRESALFNRALREIRAGKSLNVRKGESIANMGKSGNVTLNSARPEMIYPHIHLEINDGRIDPMQVIEGIGSRWFEIRDHHLNHPFYRNWLKQAHNWSWYSKFYPNGAVPDDKRKG
ncbi:MAG: hypothetical protein ACI8P9_000617 [Parasphingorhabdus sp.]